MKRSPSIPASSTVTVDATLRPQTDKIGIFGSVSTSEIATNLRAILQEHAVGVQIVLSPQDVSFVEELEEKDRAKHLGIYEFDISLKGMPTPVRRSITILPVKA